MNLVEGYADVEVLDAFLDDLGAVGEAHGCVVQAFDARYVAGEDHLAHALRTAGRAIERGEVIARDPAVEVLCYAAGTRQIEDALAIGVAEGRMPVVVTVASFDGGGIAHATDEEEPPAVEAETGAAAAVRDLIEPAALERGVELGDPERLRSYYGIDDAEIAASDADLATLVRERVALLAVER